MSGAATVGSAVTTNEERGRFALPPDALKSERSTPRSGWGDATVALMQALQLGDDWDGQGADAPSNDVVDRGFELMRSVRRDGTYPPPDRVRPCPDGTICFEWGIEGGYIEAEVSATGVEWMVYRAGMPAELLS